VATQEGMLVCNFEQIDTLLALYLECAVAMNFGVPFEALRA